MAERPIKKWMGSKTCDLCGSDYADVGPEFYDCPMPAYGGRWGNICYGCREYRGRMGQVYDSATFLKICNIQDRAWQDG